MKLSFFFLICLALFCVATHALTFTEDATTITVNTKLGPIKGHKTRTGTEFYGIPYAHAKRFENPTPVEPWAETIDAFQQGPACPQKCTSGLLCPPDDLPMSEDCLHVNIFTPKFPTTIPQQARRRPVLVFIHGGGYAVGYNGTPLYNSTLLAADVVVFTINYRLGTFGTLFHPDPEVPLIGNYGLRDQLLALHFVRALAQDFGGDPTNITLMGQSAGGSAVATLATLKETQGLVKNLIILSNPWTVPLRAATDPGTKALANYVLAQTNCTNPTRPDENDPDNRIPISYHECLQAISLDRMIEISANAQSEASIILADALIHNFLFYTPTAGTTLLPIQPFKAFTEKGYIPEDMGVIISSTSNETPQLIQMAFPDVIDKTAYMAVLTSIFGLEKILTVLQKFPASDTPGEDHKPKLIELGNLYMFERVNHFVASRLVVNRATAQDKYKVWAVKYDHVFSSAKIWGDAEPQCGRTVCHCADLPIIFGAQQARLLPCEGCDFAPREMQLSVDYQSYFWNLMYTQDVSKGIYRVPTTWQPFYKSKSLFHVAGSEFKEISYEDFMESQMWWNEIGYMKV